MRKLTNRSLAEHAAAHLFVCFANFVELGWVCHGGNLTTVWPSLSSNLPLLLHQLLLSSTEWIIWTRERCVFLSFSFFFFEIYDNPLSGRCLSVSGWLWKCLCVWIGSGVFLSLLYSLKMKKTPIIVLSKRSFSLYETILYYRIDICTILSVLKGPRSHRRVWLSLIDVCNDISQPCDLGALSSGWGVLPCLRIMTSRNVSTYSVCYFGTFITLASKFRILTLMSPVELSIKYFLHVCYSVYVLQAFPWRLRATGIDILWTGVEISMIFTLKIILSECAVMIVSCFGLILFLNYSGCSWHSLRNGNGTLLKISSYDIQ